MFGLVFAATFESCMSCAVSGVECSRARRSVHAALLVKSEAPLTDCCEPSHLQTKLCVQLSQRLRCHALRWQAPHRAGAAKEEACT